MGSAEDKNIRLAQIQLITKGCFTITHVLKNCYNPLHCNYTKHVSVTYYM